MTEDEAIAKMAVTGAVIAFFLGILIGYFLGG